MPERSDEPRAAMTTDATPTAARHRGNAAIASAALPGALVTRRVDDAVLFGGAACALAAAFVAWCWPPLLPWLFWGWLLLIDGPHLLATGLRSWADGSRREVDAAWRRRAWVAFAVPVAAWLGARVVPQAHTMELLLGLGVVLSWHHQLRQNEGIHAILAAQGVPKDGYGTGQGAGLVDRDIAVRERRGMVAWLWLAFAASAFWTPANRSAWGAGEASTLNAIAYALLAAMVACVAYVVFQGLERVRRHLPLRPWVFACLASGGVLSLAVLLVGWAEPMYAAASSAEQMFMAVTLVVGLAHGTQYLLVVLAAHRRRVHAAGSWLEISAHRPFVTLLGLGLASVVGYGAINALKGTLPGAAWASATSALGEAAMAAYWAAFFHHYYVDRYIWRIRSEPALREELGLGHG